MNHGNIENSLSLNDEKVQLEQDLQGIQTELEHLKQEKNKMLKSVRQEIWNEKERWEQEKQQLIKEGYQEGYDLGLVEGKQAAEKQYDHLIDKVNELVHMATNDYHLTLEQSEQMIVELAMKTAEKIIRKKLLDDPTLFLNIVITAIQEIKDQSVIAIYLHPNNYEAIMKQKNELTHALDGDTKLSVFVDQKMTENECMITHPFGQIDAGIDTQLQQIYNALQQISLERKS